MIVLQKTHNKIVNGLQSKLRIAKLDMSEVVSIRNRLIDDINSLTRRVIELESEVARYSNVNKNLQTKIYVLKRKYDGDLD